MLAESVVAPKVKEAPLGLEQRMTPPPSCFFASSITKPKNNEVEAAAASKAAAARGLQKAASWSDFDTKPAGNKVASATSMYPAAKVEGKAKQAAATSIEPAVKAEGKTKQAAATSIEQAVKAEGKTKQAAATSIEPAVKAEGKARRMTAAMLHDERDPVVIAITTERVDEDYIKRLRAKPMPRLTPLTEDERKELPAGTLEAHRKLDALVNETLALHEDILRQRDEKGYALVRVERLDNGKKRWYRLPQEATA